MSEPRFLDARHFDSVHGRLTTIDPKDFVPQRAFWLTHLGPLSERGGHAHRQQSQLIVLFSGWCDIEITPLNGFPWKYRVDERSGPLLIPPGLWVELKKFKSGTIVLVLASGPYDESEYVRNRKEFFA